MRLLIQSQNYAPDEIGISKYSTELAEWFAQRRWDVHVVTAPPYYPQWRVEQGYKGWAYAREMHNDVQLLRCPLYVPSHPSGLKRLLHLASYAITSGPVITAEAIRFRPDVIIAVAPNMMAALTSGFAAKLSGAVSILHVQDFEADLALQMGMVRGSGVPQLLASIEGFILRTFDHASAPSPAMVARLKRKGVSPERAFIFRNWCDTNAIRPDISSSFRQDWGLSERDVVLLYSGNLSEKQGVMTLIEAARLLADQAHIHFVICGEGPTKEKLAYAARELANVRLLPLQPSRRLPELLCAADIHVLPQVRAAADLVLPSKLSGMLASGRPIIATVLPGSGIAEEISGGGIVVPPGDLPMLCQAIVALSANQAMRKIMQRNARKRAEAHWAKDVILPNFEMRVAEAVRTKQRSSQNRCTGILS